MAIEQTKHVLIVFKEIDSNGNITLTKEELMRLVDSAYESGFSDGKNKYCIQPYVGDNQPIIKDPFFDKKETNPWWSEVTCSGNNNVTLLKNNLTVDCAGEQLPIPGLENY